jgi:adhesin transport system outer membrane protein
MKTSIFPSLFISLFVGTSLSALTLNEALDNTLTSNPVILERVQNYDKTVSDLKIAKSGYAPTLDLISKIGYKNTYDGYATSFEKNGFHMYQNSLILTQNLFNGFGTKYKVEFEEARVMAAAYNYMEKTNDIAFRVIKEYLNVLKYNDLYNIEKENVVLTRDILNKTEELANAGSGLLSDVKKVDSSLQLAEFNLLTQENNLMDAEFNLGKLLGQKVNREELILPSFLYKLPKTIEEASTHSVEYNPSLLVTNYNIKTAKSALEQGKSGFMPTLDFELAYNFDRNTSDTLGHERNYTALFVFKQNLYRGNADMETVTKNRTNIMQEYENQREIKRQIIEGLQLSWSAYTMTEKQIIFLNSYQEQSKVTLNLYKQEFEDGTRTLIDLLTAQDDYISARSKLVTASYDSLFSKYRVLDAMGELINSIFSDEAKKYYQPINAKYERVSKTNAEYTNDRDNDNVSDNMDLCDNTKLGFKVDMFGCEQNTQEVIETVPVTNSIPAKEKDNISSILENDGFIINLATFSSKEEVATFLKSTNLENNSLVINYMTKDKKRSLYKIVSGTYKSKQEATVALNNLPETVKINKPYINSVNDLKFFYNQYN